MLVRATEYAHDLKARDVDGQFIAEYVQNFVAPTDVPDVYSPDETLYSLLMEWAFNQECRFMEEHLR